MSEAVIEIEGLRKSFDSSQGYGIIGIYGYGIADGHRQRGSDGITGIPA